jgi:hypothetical protein
MGHGAGTARLHRQTRLGAVERLDLRLLVEREDDGVTRRVDLQADHVFELLGESRVGRQLEAAHPMRRQARLLPDLVHLGQRDAAGLGHGAYAQWVASPGGGASKVRRITSATLAEPSGGMRAGRVLSRNSPSTPASR